MKKKTKKQLKFGLIGRNISYSFSKKYFNEKFEIGHFDNCEYKNYDIESIKEFPKIITEIKEMISPPKEKAIYPNRFSPSGISMLYSAVKWLAMA